MHKRKDETRDIYQGGEHDFEKDFTPQVAKERVEERKRDLRRTRVFSVSLGLLLIILAVALVAVIARNFLSSRAPSQQILSKELPAISLHTLPTESLWVMDCQRDADLQNDNGSGTKPLSAKRLKKAAYHIFMGQQALAINNPDAALEHFQKALEIYPDIQGLHGAIGGLYLQNAEYKPAAEHLEKFLQEKETFDTVNSLGSAYVGLEEYEKAEKYLERAIELRPENAGCHKTLAELYRKMNRDNEAVYQFEKYIDMQPTDFDTMQNYGLYLTKLGRWKEAADLLTKLTQEVTDVAPVYFLLAQVQIQNGQQDKALAALKSGIQLIDPQLALAWMSREEFNVMRNSSEFKTLLDQLKAGIVQ